jgi:hypothetical protein
MVDEKLVFDPLSFLGFWLSITGASPELDCVFGHESAYIIPPAAAHRHQQLDCVLVALRFRPDIAKPRLLILTLCIQQSENAGAAATIVDALQTHGFRCHIEGVLLSGQEMRVVGERLQDIGDLPEGLQHGLLVIGGRRLEGCKCGAPFGLSQAAVEDRLGEPRCDAPHEARRVENTLRLQCGGRDPGRQGQGWIKSRRRDANLCARRVELGFGRLNVGAPVDEF